MHLIISALSGELAEVIRQLERPSSRQIGDIELHTGLLAGVPAAAAAPGSGKLNAALALSRLTGELKPEGILGIGVCAGIDPSLVIGTPTVVSRAVQYDLDINRFGLKTGEINGVLERFLSDTLPGRPAEQAVPVTAGSADIFLTAAGIEQHREKLEQLLVQIVDMESFSWMAAARMHGVPCRVYRIISDRPGESRKGFSGRLPEYSRILAELVREELSAVSE